MKIKDIPKEFRPRERLKLKGKETLSDIELLSIILKSGTKKKSVEDISIELLNNYKLSDLKEIDINDYLIIKEDFQNKEKRMALRISEFIGTYTKIGVSEIRVSAWHTWRFSPLLLPWRACSSPEA